MRVVTIVTGTHFFCWHKWESAYSGKGRCVRAYPKCKKVQVVEMQRGGSVRMSNITAGGDVVAGNFYGKDE